MNKSVRLFRQERARLQALTPRPEEVEALEQLKAACDRIIAKIDTQLQFVSCELSKLVRFIPNLPKLYRRRPGAQWLTGPDGADTQRDQAESEPMEDNMSNNGD